MAQLSPLWLCSRVTYTILIQIFCWLFKLHMCILLENGHSFFNGCNTHVWNIQYLRYFIYSLGFPNYVSLKYCSISNFREFFNHPFHLSLKSTFGVGKQLSILVVPPHFITDPNNYQSFLSTQCFITRDILPFPHEVLEKDFAVVGVIGNDYTRLMGIRNAMCQFALPSDDVGQPGYSGLWSIVETFFSKFHPTDSVFTKPQNGLLSKKLPSMPVEKLEGIKNDSQKVRSASRPVSVLTSTTALPTLPAQLVHHAKTQDETAPGHLSIHPISRRKVRGPPQSQKSTTDEGRRRKLLTLPTSTWLGKRTRRVAMEGAPIAKRPKLGPPGRVFANRSEKAIGAQRSRSPRIWSKVRQISSQRKGRSGRGGVPMSKSAGKFDFNDREKHKTSMNLSEDMRVTTVIPLPKLPTSVPSTSQSRSNPPRSHVDGSDSPKSQLGPFDQEYNFWTNATDGLDYPASPEWVSSPKSRQEGVLVYNQDNKTPSPEQCLPLVEETPFESFEFEFQQMSLFSPTPPRTSSKASALRLLSLTLPSSPRELPIPFNRPLPFNIPRSIMKVPIAVQSLKVLTARLLLARQRARNTDYTKLWTLEPLTGVTDMKPGCEYFAVSFDKQLISGMRLVLLLGEGPPIRRNYKLCAFGCAVNDDHQFLSNNKYAHFLFLES